MPLRPLRVCLQVVQHLRTPRVLTHLPASYVGLSGGAADSCCVLQGAFSHKRLADVPRFRLSHPQAAHTAHALAAQPGATSTMPPGWTRCARYRNSTETTLLPACERLELHSRSRRPQAAHAAGAAHLAHDGVGQNALHLRVLHPTGLPSLAVLLGALAPVHLHATRASGASGHTCHLRPCAPMPLCRCIRRLCPSACHARVRRLCALVPLCPCGPLLLCPLCQAPLLICPPRACQARPPAACGVVCCMPLTGPSRRSKAGEHLQPHVLAAPLWATADSCGTTQPPKS